MAVAIERVNYLKDPMTPPYYPEANIWPPAGYETNVIWILTEKPEQFEVSNTKAMKSAPARGLDIAPKLAAAGAVGGLAVAAAQKFADRAEKVKEYEDKDR